ncbi:unnamed protein product, partial [Musa acuminata var. zebrina]
GVGGRRRSRRCDPRQVEAVRSTRTGNITEDQMLTVDGHPITFYYLVKSRWQCMLKLLEAEMIDSNNFIKFRNQNRRFQNWNQFSSSSKFGGVRTNDFGTVGAPSKLIVHWLHIAW